MTPAQALFLKPRTARWWMAAMLVLTMGLLAGCAPGELPPEVLGPTAWRLTVSPVEPAAGIESGVTMQRIDDLGRPLRATPDDVPPHARARELDTEVVAWSGPAQVDGSGVWLAPIIFPTPGRWQVVIHEAIDSRVPIRENVRLPWPSLDGYDPHRVVRDAIGREELSLQITVIPDRGPILWWLRTHLIEVFGIAVVLTASMVSYVFRNRLPTRVER